MRRAQRATVGFVIKPIRHKGLRLFFEEADPGEIRVSHSRRLGMVLAALETATSSGDMDIPGLAIHPVTGKRKGRWAIKLSGNGRVTFAFREGNAYLLDYEDDH